MIMNFPEIFKILGNPQCCSFIVVVIEDQFVGVRPFPFICFSNIFLFSYLQQTVAIVVIVLGFILPLTKVPISFNCCCIVARLILEFSTTTN